MEQAKLDEIRSLDEYEAEEQEKLSKDNDYTKSSDEGNISLNINISPQVCK